MDIKSVKITEQDINRILAKAAPAEAAGFAGDACSIYKQAKPVIDTAVTVLRIFYAPGAAALAALEAIMDKACGS